MKTGITKRLFLYIILIVLGISALILLSNTLLLKPLYYYSIENTMVRAMDEFSQIDYSEDYTVWREEVEGLLAGNSYDIVILQDTVLFSSSNEVGLMPRPETTETDTGITDESVEPQWQDSEQDYSPFFSLITIEDWEQVTDGVYVGTVIEPKSDIEMLVCTTELDSGVSLYLTQAIEPINQSIQQANILLIACAVVSLGISAIFVFKISKRFTNPIRQIQNTVGEIAMLNFGQKCDIRTGDELESLGNDVNRLAVKLESALDTLRVQNEQLEKDIIAQRQFISNASHELRTPLSLIKGYADEMNAGYVAESKQKDLYIEIISEEAAKMNRLLKEMLELSRMESGRITLQYEKLSVNERIQMFLEKYDGYIVENKLNVSLNFKDDETGYFDAMCFEQVLANYISNAARYGDQKKQVEISTENMGESIRISVFNTGKPIPEEILSSLWDGFYKADNARTRVKDSYGLGLSVVKAIQVVAGQEFGVKNVPDGVVFWFDVQRFTEDE